MHNHQHKLNPETRVLKIKAKGSSFYVPKKTPVYTNQKLYEARLGVKEVETFRRKKSSTFQELNYSSRQNPLARGKNQRYDRTYKETYERKKKIPMASDRETDPISCRFEAGLKTSFSKQEFRNSLILDVEAEKRNELPAARKLSHPYRQYHRQWGMSASLEKLPRTRTTMDSSIIAPVLEYRGVCHSVEKITGKVGCTIDY